MPYYPGEEDLEFWREQGEVQSYVYVIQGENGGPIKVGVAKDPEARLRGLQTGNPYQLRLLYVVPGDHRLEGEMHRRLSNDWIMMGEWFEGEQVPVFLTFMERFCRTAVRLACEGSMTRPRRRRPRISSTGMRAGGYNAKLGHRWRVKPEQDAPVTTTFVDPASLR